MAFCTALTGLWPIRRHSTALRRTLWRSTSARCTVGSPDSIGFQFGPKALDHFRRDGAEAHRAKPWQDVPIPQACVAAERARRQVGRGVELPPFLSEVGERFPPAREQVPDRRCACASRPRRRRHPRRACARPLSSAPVPARRASAPAKRPRPSVQPVQRSSTGPPSPPPPHRASPAGCRGEQHGRNGWIASTRRL